MQKVFISILFSITFCSSYGQRNLIQELYWNKEKDWKYISIDVPDSIKKEIINSNKELKIFLSSPQVGYNNFTFTDFNNDQKMDIILSG